MSYEFVITCYAVDVTSRSFTLCLHI